MRPARVLVTGRPGVGKTTLVEKVARALGGRAGGFLTREVRRGGRRVGFRLVTLDGREGDLARLDHPGPPRVGSYGVLPEVVEGIGAAAVVEAVAAGQVVVIDEIGPMELFSGRFREAVMEALSSPSSVLASVTRKPDPFADVLKAREDCEVVEVTVSNRDRLARELAARFVANQRAHGILEAWILQRTPMPAGRTRSRPRKPLRRH